MAEIQNPKYTNLLNEIKRLVFTGPSARDEWDNDVIRILFYNAVLWDDWYFDSGVNYPRIKGSDKLFKLILTMVSEDIRGLGKSGTVQPSDVTQAVYGRLMDWNNWVWDEVDAPVSDDSDVLLDAEIYGGADGWNQYSIDSNKDSLTIGNTLS